MIATETKGVCCKSCGCRDLPVKRTRPAMNDRIMRIRVCRNCGRSQTTYEVIAGQAIDPPVIEDLTPIQREKLLSRILGMLGMNRG